MTVAQLAEKWLSTYVRPKLKPGPHSTTKGCSPSTSCPHWATSRSRPFERADVERCMSNGPDPRRANYTIALRALINIGIDLGLRPTGQ